jgi:hypothetical protein
MRAVLCKARMTVRHEKPQGEKPDAGNCIGWDMRCSHQGVPMNVDTSLAEKISEVPELYDRNNKSTACLLKDLGLLNSPEPLKVEEVEEALSHHPDWADKWLERGHDQLLAGGWGIECDHGRYRVQSFSSGRHLLEQKKLHAVAEFVVRYVGFIRDVLDRSRRPVLRRNSAG